MSSFTSSYIFLYFLVHLYDIALNFDVVFFCQSVYIDDTDDGQTNDGYS